MPNPGGLTESQQKWFEALHDGLERDTGRTLAQWADIARACPETTHRNRLAWMKQHHWLGQNRASLVLNTAFPPAASWSAPEELEAALWKEPASRAMLAALRDEMTRLPDSVIGQRKGFTAFSRTYQFAAAKPDKLAVRLGLAVPPDTDPMLQATARESWSERLLSRVTLYEPADLTPRLCHLLRAAWERS